MRIPRLFTIIGCLLLCVTAMASSSSTYYAQAKAEATPTGAGKVYVATAQDATPSYSETSSATNSGESSESSVSIAFYLFAEAATGQMLDHWEDESGASVGSNNPQKVTISASSTNQSAPNSKTWKAVFSEASALLMFNTSPYGTATIDKLKNTIGDKVKLTAAIKRVPSYNCKNQLVDFLGWYNMDTDECLSTALTYTHTVTEPINITPKFHYYGGIESGGYYRIMNSFGRAMTTEGSYSITSNSNADLSGLLYWTMPEGLVYADFQNKKYYNDTEPTEIETVPATLFYVKGTPDSSASTGKLTSATCRSQGVDTKGLTGKVFTIQPTTSMPGYHEIIYSSYSLKYGNKTFVDNNDGCQVQIGNSGDNAYQWMAFVPVNEENIDTFWFGVHPDASMEFDDGLWSSLYTDFPYMCYEPDGVEAYYIRTIDSRDGANYCVLEKIEDGLVPARTAVLLKCRKPEPGLEDAYSSRNNRLLPLDPDVYTIPALEENMLRGEFQLNKSASNPAHVTFDYDKMRVFGCNSNGEVGFYSLASGTELTANRVWLNIEELSQAAKVAPMRIGVGAGSSAITEIEAETPAAIDGPIFDLQGRQVQHCEPGKIYIINGRKILRL